MHLRGSCSSAREGVRPTEPFLDIAQAHNMASFDFLVESAILEPMPEEVSTLYRPVGQGEFDLVRASGFCRFPPRLPPQPFFYPVLTEPYATQIARDWNTKDESSGFVGYVLRFMVRSEFLKRYEIHIVGSAEHREYWIPRGDLEALNDNIVGNIEVISEFRREI
jgi:hypothetical protein